VLRAVSYSTKAGLIMAKQTFPANDRRVVDVDFNGASGLCDVVVSDKRSNQKFAKTMVLAQYIKLADWLKEDDHGFAMMFILNLLN
jgi:hypothetical protein